MSQQLCYKIVMQALATSFVYLCSFTCQLSFFCLAFSTRTSLSYSAEFLDFHPKPKSYIYRSNYSND